MGGIFQFSHTWGVLTGDPSPITPVLTRTLAGSHSPTFEARVLSTFQVGDDPDGVTIPIAGGAVVLDGTASIERSLDLTTLGPTFPRRLGDLLLPDGTEVFVRRGVDLGDQILWFPLGYFRLQDVDQDDAPDGQIRLAGFDRMSGIIDAELVTPMAFEPHTTYGQIFRTLVRQVYPAAVVAFDDIALDHEPVGRLLLVDRSRYEPLRTLAHGRGKIVHFDDLGILRVRTAPDPDVPVWDVRASSGGVQTHASRRVTRSDVVNVAVIRSQGGDTQDPARAVAIDDGPNSPTRVGGRFGIVPHFETIPASVSGPQAAQAAVDTLQRMAGLPYQVEFGAVPNPALRPFDPIRVTLRDGSREKHVVERLAIPLRAQEPMSGSTRERRRSRVRVVSVTDIPVGEVEA